MTQHNDINRQVYALLEDLSTYGMKSEPRGQKVVEANLCTLELDPGKPIMNFETRPFNYRYFAGEVAWYLKRNSTIDFIKDFSSFWVALADENNEINSNYGSVLLADHPSTRAFGPRNTKNQLEWVFNSLKKDKDSRQAVAFLNAPFYQYAGNKDFVCTMYLNFWIRHDNLDMKVQMRSNDIFFGLTYDAPWFSLLHQSLYLNLKKEYPNLKLGMYYHSADNIHYYERHFDLVETIINSPIQDSPLLRLKSPLFEFDKSGIKITEASNSYIAKVEAMVQEEKLGEKKKTNEEWKNVLSDIVDFE